MKKQLLHTIIMTATILCMSALKTFAGIFYVCSGTEFTLKADLTTEYAAYEWKEGSSSLATTSTYKTTITLATSTTAQVKTYTLRVKSSDGCWSEYATHTVYVLPALTASITGTTYVCINDDDISEDLTASTNFDDLNLDAVPEGVSYSFSWTGGGTASGAKNYKNTITEAGDYEVSVAYVLPDNDGTKLTSCVGTDDHTVTGKAPSVPTVTIE